MKQHDRYSKKTYKLFGDWIEKIYFLILLTALTSCGDKEQGNNDASLDIENEEAINISSEEASYRPNFHFTSKKNWMNDPNEMFFYKGLYHLYFQHYPEDNVWVQCIGGMPQVLI